MSPSVRREAVEVLFGRHDGIEALLDAIESGAIASDRRSTRRGGSSSRCNTDPAIRNPSAESRLAAARRPRATATR